MRIATLLSHGLLYNTIALGVLTTTIGILACPLEAVTLQRAFLYFSAATVICATAAIVQHAFRPQHKRLALGLSISLGPLALFWLFLLLLPLNEVREMSGRGMMGLQGKHIGLAIHDFHDRQKVLPVDLQNAVGPSLSWRVSLCPYIEEMPLYRQFDLTKAWDSPGNRPLVEKEPFAFRSVLFHESPGNTPWQAFVGPGTAFDPVAGPLTLARGFPDGTSNTILFVEAKQQVPWSKPADIPYGPGIPLPSLGQNYPRRGDWPFCCPVPGRPIFHVCMVDGTVRVMSGDISETVLRAMIVRNDGQPAEMPE